MYICYQNNNNEHLYCAMSVKFDTPNANVTKLHILLWAYIYQMFKVIQEKKANKHNFIQFILYNLYSFVRGIKAEVFF